MDYEELVSKVLEKRRDLSREELEKLVDKMTREMPFLNRAGALLILLGETGAGSEVGEARDYSLTNIAELTPGLGRVNIRGRVIAIGFTQLSEDRRVARLKLGDGTGKVEVVCWDEKAEQLAGLQLKPGDVAEVRAGYTRASQLTGRVEVHVGKQGSVERSTDDAGIPPLTKLFTPVSEALAGSEEMVDLLGVVLYVGKRREVSVEGGESSLAEIVLSDGRMECLLTVWEEPLSQLSDIRLMDVVMVSQVRRRDEGFATTARSQIIKPAKHEFDELVKSAEQRVIHGRRYLVLDRVDTPTRRVVICTDGSGVLRMEDVQEFRRGDCFRADYAVKLTRRGKTYLYASNISQIAREGCEGVRFSPTRIRLEQNPVPAIDVIITGTITGKTPLSKTDTRYGEREVIHFWLKQGEKVISGSAWGGKAIELDKIPEGTNVELRWVSLRLNRYNELELRLDQDSVIEPL